MDSPNKRHFPFAENVSDRKSYITYMSHAPQRCPIPRKTASRAIVPALFTYGRPIMRRFVLALILMNAFAACSKSNNDGVCTNLENTAPEIAVTTSDAAVPTGTGGTVAEGTYFLTAVVRTPSSPVSAQLTFRQTFRISGNTLETVAKDSDKSTATKGEDTFTTNGSSIVFTRVCSSDSSSAELQYGSYTADATHLNLYSVPLGISVFFTRQP